MAMQSYNALFNKLNMANIDATQNTSVLAYLHGLVYKHYTINNLWDVDKLQIHLLEDIKLCYVDMHNVQMYIHTWVIKRFSPLRNIVTVYQLKYAKYMNSYIRILASKCIHVHVDIVPTSLN